MKRAMFFLAASLAVACGDTATQPTNEPDEVGFTFDDTDDEVIQVEDDGRTEAASLMGTTWLGEQIGNAVFTQEWWSFGPDQSFKEADVFAVYQGDVQLEKFVGEWSEVDGTISVTAQSLTQSIERTFTFAVEGMALYPNAYRPVDELSWHRTTTDESSSQSTYTRTAAVIDISFDQQPKEGLETCMMNVTMDVQLVRAANTAGESAVESFAIACAVEPVESGLSVRGTNGWTETLETAGVWDNHSAALSSAFFELFQPELVLLESGELVHARSVRQRRTQHSMPERAEDVPTNF